MVSGEEAKSQTTPAHAAQQQHERDNKIQLPKALTLTHTSPSTIYSPFFFFRTRGVRRQTPSSANINMAKLNTQSGVATATKSWKRLLSRNAAAFPAASSLPRNVAEHETRIFSLGGTFFALVMSRCFFHSSIFASLLDLWRNETYYIFPPANVFDEQELDNKKRFLFCKCCKL